MDAFDDVKVVVDTFEGVEMVGAFEVAEVVGIGDVRVVDV